MTPLMARAVLGINREDDTKAIKRKWRKLAMQYHPDRGGDAAMFLRLVDAFQFLMENPMFVANATNTNLQLSGPAPKPVQRKRLRYVDPWYWDEQSWLEQEFGHLGYWTRRGTIR